MSAQPQPQPTEIDIAAQALRDAKRSEEDARIARLVAEEDLITLIGVKAEGTTTVKTEFFKVSTVGKLTRSLDEAAFRAIADDIPAAFRDRLVRWKPELVAAEVRHIEHNEPEIYRVLAQALTVKPAKPAVSVELI